MLGISSFSVDICGIIQYVDLCRSPFCLLSLMWRRRVRCPRLFLMESETHIKSLTKLETSDKSEFYSQVTDIRKQRENRTQGTRDLKNYSILG